MLDIWYTFPATMGESQAWITYNHGYAEVAEADPRHTALRIKLSIKNPNGYGMPTNEEFAQLSAVDEELDKRLSDAGGVYVGRVTVDGNRFFYFYLDLEEKKAAEIINDVSIKSSYQIQHIFENDIKKKYYWNELYPTDADWQVIQDLKVLDSLSENGDIKERQREVMHWAYFPNELSCNQFKDWVKSENYTLHFNGKEVDSAEFLTQYSHFGTMNFGDITSHTIKFNRAAREFGGRYDGWETSVERE